MKFLSRIVLLMIWLPLLCVSFLDAQEPDSLPPLPIGDLATRVIFPNEHIQSVVSVETSVQTYLFPVSAGDLVNLDLNRIEGDLVPFMSLRTSTGRLIAEQEPRDLAGRHVNIEHTAEANEWYLVDVKFDPASASYGGFDLHLTGTTNALYQLLDVGQPPDVENAVYLIRGSVIRLNAEEDAAFLIALNADEVLHAAVVPSTDINLTLQATSGGTLEPAAKVVDGVLTYTNGAPQWVLLSVLSGRQEALSVDIAISDVEKPESTLAAYRLVDLITPSPTPTISPTPTNTATMIPSTTPSRTPTPTSLPTRTPTRTLTPAPAPVMIAPPQLLTGGYGLTNGARMGPGEFQVEYHCLTRGYGISHDDNNWYCTSGNRVAFPLTQEDFDTICQETYGRLDAFAQQDGSGSIPAYRWRCYGP